MPKRQHRISYIRKPFARKSLVSLPFSCLALAGCVVSLAISVYHQGNGDVNVAAWGFSSIVFAVISLLYSAASFVEQEKNYILSKISLIISAVLLVFWVCMLIVGLIG